MSSVSLSLSLSLAISLSLSLQLGDVSFSRLRFSPPRLLNPNGLHRALHFLSALGWPFMLLASFILRHKLSAPNHSSPATASHKAETARVSLEWLALHFRFAILTSCQIIARPLH